MGEWRGHPIQLGMAGPPRTALFRGTDKGKEVFTCSHRIQLLDYRR